MMMKARTIVLVIASCLLCGQRQAQSQPRSEPNWLRVGLRVDSPEQQIRDLFTRQLRKLGDVEVAPMSDPLSRSQGRSELPDVSLKILVYETSRSLQDYRVRGPRYALAVIATHPLAVDAAHPDLEPKEIFAASWLVVADESDLEKTCADLISKFDHEVLEADRKRIRFPEPPSPEPRGFGRGVGFGPGEEKNATGHCDITPSLIYKVEAEYSQEANKANYQGTVVVAVEVDPTGHVVNPRVIRSLGLGLDEKAIEAVRQWRFRPGSNQDGQPLSCGATIEVNFRLGKK
jgi:TonB family protein